MRRSKAGEEVIVTKRDKPIAVLQPIRSATNIRSLKTRLAQLAAQGWPFTPQRRPLMRVRRVKAGGPPLSAIILDERR